MIDSKVKTSRTASDLTVSVGEQELKKRSRRDFLALAVGGLASVGGWKWLNSRAEEDGTPGPYRRFLEFNEKITGNALFSDRHLAPEFPISRVRQIRVNGDVGLSGDVTEDNWRLQLTPYGADHAAHALDMRAIRSLPKVEETIEWKCVEGWSTVTNWGGVRLSDFTARFARGSEKARYVGMATPDEEYYVGVDMPSALHPQTLLAYEKDGKPLSTGHGAPLRLVIPLKYGIKNLKRIGSITYTDTRPPDYWAEEGYDYYAAL